MKLGMDEVLKVSYKCKGRIQGRAKVVGRGVPYFNELLLQTGRLQQQTKCKAVL